MSLSSTIPTTQTQLPRGIIRLVKIKYQSRQVRGQAIALKYAERIQVARNCLSYTIAAIVDQSADSPDSDGIDSGIDIPTFVSTGQGRLNLLQDIERCILRVGQPRRQFTHNDDDNSAYSSDRSTKAADIRHVQRHIDKTTRELLELAMRISGKSRKHSTNDR
ncbi:hypothetical protein JG687_00006896 [Phytophthora cactorum]|uniref:Uncharacterized protein n=1 Tax=Phytophthora cactorum TaxID=29920 RepID=A0A8T1UGN9_9STRA|nr:hypothetical protein JG687_00006896 [Phytophthora cactorum]